MYYGSLSLENFFNKIFFITNTEVYTNLCNFILFKKKWKIACVFINVSLFQELNSGWFNILRQKSYIVCTIVDRKISPFNNLFSNEHILKLCWTVESVTLSLTNTSQTVSTTLGPRCPSLSLSRSLSFSLSQVLQRVSSNCTELMNIGLCWSCSLGVFRGGSPQENY